MLGEAFQNADDLVDIAGDPEFVGKATGKGAAAHKATFIVPYLGIAAFGTIAKNSMGRSPRFSPACRWGGTQSIAPGLR